MVGPDATSSATASPPPAPVTGLPSAGKTGPGAVTTPADKTTPAAKPARRPVKPLVIPDHGPGKFVPATVGIKSADRKGRLIRFHVRVEKGLPFRPNDTARTVAGILNDKRSWRGAEAVRFELVPGAKPAALEIYVATSGTTDKMCLPLRTQGLVSCSKSDKVIMNADRWVYGVKYYGKDVVNYRRYLVNHEVGHTLGHNHQKCPAKGKLAPVMMQQTKGLDGCRPNPWPRAKSH